jgi:hypothetical protein
MPINSIGKLIKGNGTFIATPYNFKIELQTNEDAIDSFNHQVKIQELKLTTKKAGLESDLFSLFGNSAYNISTEVGDEVTIKQAVIKNLISSSVVDPNGVEITSDQGF